MKGKMVQMSKFGNTKFYKWLKHSPDNYRCQFSEFLGFTQKNIQANLLKTVTCKSPCKMQISQNFP